MNTSVRYLRHEETSMKTATASLYVIIEISLCLAGGE
jgi:hypothetical protein